MLRLLPLLAAASLALAGPRDVAARVNPFIGTGNLGHTHPGATVPFGMVQPGPDTRLKGWGSCGGYVKTDRVIFGFSQTHLSGVGIPDYGDILLLPATGPVKWRTGYLGTSEDAPGFDGAGYGSHFDPRSEAAAPGSYAVTLTDYDVRAELTATRRVAFHRYTFTKAQGAHVLLDLSHHDTLLGHGLHVVDDHTIAGFRRSKAWAKDQPVFFVATFDHPFRADFGGGSDRVALHFALKAGEAVKAKVALSAVDEAGARRNLDAELPGWDFEGTRAAARAAWNRELGKVEVAGGTREQLTLFYTALYHAFLQPNTFQDVDGRYLGRDLKVHRAQGWTQHTVFSLWDTYRAAHPLYTLLQPERDLDFIRTFLAQYRDGGRLPVWELWANETDCMIGYHAIPVIVDAWMKGIRGFDPERALEAMKHSAEENVRGLAAYREHGYIPADAEPESVSKTLEYAYDDWCIARFAKAIGHEADAAEYTRRAQAWQHLMDAQGFFHPRANGMWLEPFNLNAVTFHFTEATPWQYAFAAPQAMSAFVARLGGPEALDRHLDGLFAASSAIEGWEEEDVTGLVGQYAHGNEPSHHIAYLYAFAGKPWKTQARVRELMASMYADRPDGLAGNEDCGQMSAWYVFSALGFYPVAPGRPEYVIGSPLFPEVKLHLPGGRTFTIHARHTDARDPYVQSARLNGRAWTQARLAHADLLRGGVLDFEMGPRPSRWGATPLTDDSAGDPVVPAPTAAGEALFQGRTALTFEAAPGAVLHVTSDGSDPKAAPAWTPGALELDRDATLRFRSHRGDAWSPEVQTRVQRLPDFPTLKLESPLHPAFRARGPLSLIDGRHGTTDFRAGDWVGVFGQDLRATLDLGAVKEVHEATLGCLQDPYTWTYLPEAVRVELSEDGTTWRAAGSADTPGELKRYGPHLHDGKTLTHTYAVPLAGRARYIRVVAVSLRTIPKGSWREGSPCFLCADELSVH